VKRAWTSAVFAALVLLATAAVLAAQPSGKVPRVGILGERAADDPFLAAFRQGLQEFGHVPGGNIALEYRYLNGMSERAPALAAELVALKADVLVVGGTVSAQAARAATATIPIVFTSVGDPVASGLATSLARPGRNVTGVTNVSFELLGKQLEFLKALVPQVSRIAILHNPTNPAMGAAVLDAARTAARTLGVQIHFVEVRRPADIERAFSAANAWRAGAVLAASDPVLGFQLEQVAKLAAQHRLPTVYSRREFPDRGGLLAYGPSFAENYRRAALYVDKILRGAKAGELPVEQPTKFDLVINLKTARALHLTIPPALLARADEVIP
jgi:putative tryptophan/tyrosine transport system substrate-binding protein